MQRYKRQKNSVERTFVVGVILIAGIIKLITLGISVMKRQY